MRKAEISEGDLMGEQLGIVHICTNCHKRIYVMDDNIAEIVRSMNLHPWQKLFREEIYAHLNERTGEYKIRCKQNDPNMIATPRKVDWSKQ
jgi:hypothetical protein